MADAITIFLLLVVISLLLYILFLRSPDEKSIESNSLNALDPSIEEGFSPNIINKRTDSATGEHGNDNQNPYGFFENAFKTTVLGRHDPQEAGEEFVDALNAPSYSSIPSVSSQSHTTNQQISSAMSLPTTDTPVNGLCLKNHMHTMGVCGAGAQRYPHPTTLASLDLTLFKASYPSQMMPQDYINWLYSQQSEDDRTKLPYQDFKNLVQIEQGLPLSYDKMHHALQFRGPAVVSYHQIQSDHMPPLAYGAGYDSHAEVINYVGPRPVFR